MSCKVMRDGDEYDIHVRGCFIVEAANLIGSSIATRHTHSIPKMVAMDRF